jgi:Holliday junction resolvase RusA-like endonuclease
MSGARRARRQRSEDAVVATGAVTIVIGGEPVAKGRPRMTRRGIAYTPAATRRYEAHGRLAAQLAMDARAPIAVPVRADITVDLLAPASWSAKRRDAALRGDIRPTTRPDCDNYVKAGLDCINNIVVTDDSLVVDLVVTKKYAAVPALTIVITPLTALTAQGKTTELARQPVVRSSLADPPHHAHEESSK